MCAAGLLGKVVGDPSSWLSSQFSTSLCLPSYADGRGGLCHLPKADRLVKVGYCWRLRQAMRGARRASELWAENVKFAL